jgi:Ca2+-binding EF-hand superfamily protein
MILQIFGKLDIIEKIQKKIAKNELEINENNKMILQIFGKLDILDEIGKKIAKNELGINNNNKIIQQTLNFINDWTAHIAAGPINGLNNKKKSPESPESPESPKLPESKEDARLIKLFKIIDTNKDKFLTLLELVEYLVGEGIATTEAEAIKIITDEGFPTNKDAKITLEEFIKTFTQDRNLPYIPESAEETFKIIDENRYNFLTLFELVKYLKVVGAVTTQDEAIKFLSSTGFPFSTNPDAEITLKEFIIYTNLPSKSESP